MIDVNTFVVVGIMIIGAFVVFMSTHVVNEQKKGKCIPLPWEKNKRKIFDKSNIKYRDGDNT